MKKILLTLAIVASATLFSCNQETKKETYECPMQCEGKTFSESGKCAVCGMDLEKIN